VRRWSEEVEQGVRARNGRKEMERELELSGGVRSWSKSKELKGTVSQGF